jgi:hypothetical protein
MKVLFFSCLSLVFGVAVAGNSIVTIKGDFEGNGKVGYFKYDAANVENGVDYYSPSTNDTVHYSIDIKGECGLVQLYKPNGSKNKIVIDGSCMGQGAQVHEYIYEWNKQSNGWCLRSEVTGEKADSTSGSDADLTTTTVCGCIGFDKPSN